MAQSPSLHPSGNLKRSKTTTFQHAVYGLLTKRADLFNETAQLRERADSVKRDIAAIDRTLDVLGYSGELDAVMPRRTPVKVFEQGELTRLCFDTLRHSAPQTARSIALAYMAARGDDTGDRKAVKAMIDRVSRCLRKERSRGRVVAQTGEGKALLWSIAPVTR